MTNNDNPEFMLRDTASFALKACKFKPPKTHDSTARDQYFVWVAAQVVEQIKLSGWVIRPPLTLQKKPPLR